MRRRGDGAGCAVCRAPCFRHLIDRMSPRTPGRLIVVGRRDTFFCIEEEKHTTIQKRKHRGCHESTITARTHHNHRPLGHDCHRRWRDGPGHRGRCRRTWPSDVVGRGVRLRQRDLVACHQTGTRWGALPGPGEYFARLRSPARTRPLAGKRTTSGACLAPCRARIHLVRPAVLWRGLIALQRLGRLAGIWDVTHRQQSRVIAIGPHAEPDGTQRRRGVL